MKREVIKKGELLKTLFVLFNDLSNKKVKSYLKNGSVLVNGNVITKYNYIVNPKDIIEINKINKTHKKSSIEIIYEDNYFLVVNKPNGLLSIATNKEKEKTVYHLIREFIKGRNKNDKIFILHRLDKDTSGVLIFVKDNTLKNILHQNFNKYVMNREYYAVVNGKINDFENYICYIKEIGPDKVVVCDQYDKDAKKTITSVTNIKSNGKYSLIKINIKTGRRNQIRVVLNHLGNSIVGDKKYGGIKSNRLYLHSSKVSLINPLNNKEYSFVAAIPFSFNKLVGDKYE